MRHARPGYSILEMIAALSLLTVFLIIAGQLVNRVVVIQRDAVDMGWSISQMDFALRQLRRDVWTASAISVSPASDDSDTAERIALDHHDGTRVVWSFEPDASHRFPGRGWMQRVVLGPDGSPETDESATRYEVPHGIFPIDTPTTNGLEVEIDQRPIWLPSQVMLARADESVSAGGAR